ncbi:MAG: ZIP family metal transporter [Acidobacteria bacterium]|nr:ZIP family metal transporter [Acidobacteriota bacterium]
MKQIEDEKTETNADALPSPAAQSEVPLKESNEEDRRGLPTLVMFVLPVLLLAIVIWVFMQTNAGLSVTPPVPIEKLQTERMIMDETGFNISVRNLSPEPLALSQVTVNDAIWTYEVQPGTTIPRLGGAVIRIPYPWVKGEAYSINLFSSNAIVFPVKVPVAFATPRPQLATFWSFTLIGIYVGVIPVFLGLLWFPALRRTGAMTWLFLLAATAGILVYLGIDATSEALELSGEIGSTFQGVGLLGIGMAASVLLLSAISRRQKKTGRDEVTQRRALATTIAVGIGLHNLGEGLAIGAAYAIGELALGSFLVIGFIIQNITEGLGIIAPLVRDRPSVKTLLVMGLIAGAPAIVGCWIGGFTYSLPFSLLFLAIGAGAVFQVAWELAKMIQPKLETSPRASFVAFAGVITGMALLYITGLLVK